MVKRQLFRDKWFDMASIWWRWGDKKEATVWWALSALSDVVFLTPNVTFEKDITLLGGFTMENFKMVQGIAVLGSVYITRVYLIWVAKTYESWTTYVTSGM